MRKSAHREYGKFLSSYKGIQSVDRGDTRLNKFVGIIARGGVDRLAVDIHCLFGNDGLAAVAGIPHAVEHASQHVAGNGKLLAVPQKAGAGIGDFQALRTLKELHDRLVAVDFQNLSSSDFAVRADNIDEFVIGDSLHAVYDHKGSDGFGYRLIFLKHLPSPPRRSL